MATEVKTAGAAMAAPVASPGAVASRPATPQKKRYHLMLLSGPRSCEAADLRCPVAQHLALAGVSFRLRTIVPAKQEDEPDHVYPGSYARLTDAQVAAVRAAAAKRRVRFAWLDDRKRYGRCAIWHIEPVAVAVRDTNGEVAQIPAGSASFYEPQPNDEPLERYIRITEVADGAGVTEIPAAELQLELEKEHEAAEAREAERRARPEDEAWRREVSRRRREEMGGS